MKKGNTIMERKENIEKLAKDLSSVWTNPECPEELDEAIGLAMTDLYNLCDMKTYEKTPEYINGVLREFWKAEDKRRMK